MDLDNFKKELLTPRHSVLCRFRYGHEIPLTNLDWGSGSLPLRYLEGEVSEMVWKHSSNPNSCGNLVGSTTADIIENGKIKILKTLGLSSKEYGIMIGGQGSSYWLERIAYHIGPCKLISSQKELHNSVVHPWKSNEDLKSFIYAIYLSSHVTGTMLEYQPQDLEIYRKMGIPILIDATCFLSHHATLPSWLNYFDYLVFSGHKFPGGVGASGCLIYNRKHNFPPPPGSPDVYGIFKLFKSFEVRTEIMKKEIKSDLVDKFIHGITSIETKEYKIEYHRWDEGRVMEPIISFSVYNKKHRKIVHPELVTKILLEGYGLQIRFGGLCSDFGEQQHRGTGILKEGVCRISVSKYLLSEDFVEEIIDKFTSFIYNLSTFIYMYEIKNNSWKIRDCFVEKSEQYNDESYSEPRCLFCTYKPRLKNFDLESSGIEYLTYGGGLLDKIMSEVFPNMIQTIISNELKTDPYLKNTDRWFIHPLELIEDYYDEEFFL